ncbi:MAG: hypothetical protein ABSA64_01500 [Sedimentisphaerales bacterium]|jgi:hypothetical protein
MDKEVTLKLPSNMVGQMLDGLRERTKVWRDTEQYMEEGCIDDESCFIEECTSAHEARSIAEYYEEIMGAIEKQLEMAKKKSASL